MDEKTADRIIELIESSSISLLDITGGAPEINAHFKRIALAARKKGIEVIDRCNLTILFEEGHEDLGQFLADNQVKVVASLPCYSKDNVDSQRGGGAFDKSIEGIRVLNSLGYAQEGSALELDLVYNPLGAYLPPSQAELEAQYKEELQELFDLQFNRLYTITNVPIKRFRHYLEREEKLDEYMNLLLENFNPHAVEGLMCKELVSISYDGFLYDCDFNQMLELPIGKKKTSIWEIETLAELESLPIATANHCYACTAGAGSSCSGATV